jgi:acyl CoA:acetate/3-ketoacid CoA transferase beta subunit
VTVEDVRAATKARFTIADEVDQTPTASLARRRVETEVGA